MANWNKVLQNSTRKYHKTRDKENASRIPHQYKEDDKVIIQDYVGEHRRLERPTLGPYTITRTFPKTGNVEVQRDRYREVVNIRNFIPYN